MIRSKDLKCVSVLSAFFYLIKHYTEPIIHAGITILSSSLSALFFHPHLSLISLLISCPIIIILCRILRIMWGNSTKTGKHTPSSSTVQVLSIISSLFSSSLLFLYIFSHIALRLHLEMYMANQAIQVRTLYVLSPSPPSLVHLVLLSSLSSHDHFFHFTSAPSRL